MKNTLYFNQQFISILIKKILVWTSDISINIDYKSKNNLLFYDKSPIELRKHKILKLFNVKNISKKYVR